MQVPRLQHDVGSSRRAFSLIELILCIGIILVLIGLAMPQFSKVRKSGRDTRAAAAVRQGVAFLTLYTADYRDYFPRGGEIPGRSMNDWNLPLVAAGYVASLNELDPDGVKECGCNRIALSGCLGAPAEEMTPGNTRPIELANGAWVRQSQVAFPSAKGALVQSLHMEGAVHVFWTWNTINSPISPIGMVDGSLIKGKCTDFRLAHPFFENWVGHPVLSTWGGYHGLDVRN